MGDCVMTWLRRRQSVDVEVVRRREPRRRDPQDFTLVTNVPSYEDTTGRPYIVLFSEVGEALAVAAYHGAWEFRGGLVNVESVAFPYVADGVAVGWAFFAGGNFKAAASITPAISVRPGDRIRIESGGLHLGLVPERQQPAWVGRALDVGQMLALPVGNR